MEINNGIKNLLPEGTNFTIKLGLANKFAFTRDNRPVYRSLVCAYLPAGNCDTSTMWYEELFIEMKKIVLQLCYHGRGTPATENDLVQYDKYFISFYYFDSIDGDLIVFDTCKELYTVLHLTIQNNNNKKSHIKFKADVIIKPDCTGNGTTNTSHNINSTTQLCDVMCRKVKAKQLNASINRHQHQHQQDTIHPTQKTLSPLSDDPFVFQPKRMQQQKQPQLYKNNNIRFPKGIQIQTHRYQLNKNQSKTPDMTSPSDIEKATNTTTGPTNTNNTNTTIVPTTGTLKTKNRLETTTTTTDSPIGTFRTTISHFPNLNNFHTNSSNNQQHYQSRLFVLPGYGKKKNNFTNKRNKQNKKHLQSVEGSLATAVAPDSSTSTETVPIVNTTTTNTSSTTITHDQQQQQHQQQNFNLSLVPIINSSPRSSPRNCTRTGGYQKNEQNLTITRSSELSVYTHSTPSPIQQQHSVLFENGNCKKDENDNNELYEYDSLIGSIDMWQTSALTTNDNDDDDDIDNISTHVFVEEKKSSYSSTQVSI